MPAAPATHPARRTDAGTVKLTDRDITGLTLVADQYGAPVDLLASAPDVREDRPRGIIGRWRHAGWAETGVLGKGPGWCWLTPAGMRLLGLGYSAREPSVTRLAHIRAAAGGRVGIAHAPTPKFTGPPWTVPPTPGRSGPSKPNSPPSHWPGPPGSCGPY